MATAQYGGMFGPSPEEALAARQQQIQDNARRDLNLTPIQQAQAQWGEFGGMLGDAVGGAMGYENPAVARAKKIQEATRGADTTSADGLLSVAAKLNSMGLYREAQMAADKSREVAKSQQELELSKAHAAYYAKDKADPKEVMMLEIANDPAESPEKRKMAADWLAKNGKGSPGGTGRTQTLNTSVGMLNFDPYSKKYTYADGSDVPPEMLRMMTPIGNDPTNAAAVASAKAGGTEVGKAAGGAQVQLPKIENDLSTVQALGTKLFNHPGYKSLVGAGFPGMKYLQGSAVPGAKALVDQIQGIGYLMAREELRGQGQVTEGEATAATAAFNRMNTATSEADFREAYDDFVKRVENVRNILRQKASMTFGQQTAKPVTHATENASTVKPFSGIRTPYDVRNQLKAGSITREQANRILYDMEQNGVQIK